MPGPDQEDAPKPAYVVAIKADIHKLEKARQTSEKARRNWSGLMIAMLLHVVFLFPIIFSRYAHLVSSSNLLTRLALYLIIDMSFPMRERAAVVNSEAKKEVDRNRVASTPTGIVQSL